jgi:hypothetical protein
MTRLWAESASTSPMRRERPCWLRVCARQEICRDLIAGRLTLAEAARRLGDLSDSSENFWDQIRLGFAGATDDERMCRRAIELACGLLHGNPIVSRTCAGAWKGDSKPSGPVPPPVGGAGAGLNWLGGVVTSALAAPPLAEVSWPACAGSLRAPVRPTSA